MKKQSTILRKARRGWRSGQSAVEVAFFSLALLPVMLGMIDAGRLFFTYLQVSEAARAGTQYGAQSLQTSSDDTGMGTYATNAAPNVSGISATGSHFCCCPNSTGTTCTNFGNSTSTIFTQSCGVDPLTQAPPCPDWRKYEQVTATGSFSTLITYPWIPRTTNFTIKSLLRSK